MFIRTILLVASLLSVNSFASATSISRDAATSLSSSNDENNDINSLLIEYNQIIATRNHYDSDNLLLNSNDRIIEEDEGCDESFPLAPTTATLPSSLSLSLDHDETRRQLKVAIPPSQNNIQTSKWYESGEYYAPTCHDVKTNKRRIDIRYLQQCFGGACWDPQIGVSFHSKI